MPRITADLPSREATATERLGSRAADRFVVGLILVFEACAAVAVLLMLRLAVRFLLAQDHSITQITSQAARSLSYWALLLYVHAIALAWFRRANSAGSALCGFAGIVYLGCGYVFSLVLASAGDVPRLARGAEGLLGNRRGAQPDLAELPGRLLVALAGAEHVQACRECPLWRPAGRERSVAGFRNATEGVPYSAGPVVARSLLPLVGTTLFLVAAFSVIVVWWTGTLVANWVLKQSADRSLDFVGAACYGGVYLLASLLVLAAAVVCGRRGLQRDDPDLVWRAGILAAVGGLQHIVFLGLPALAGGILAMRAANRRTPRPAGTLVEAIRQSWGLPGAVAFFLLTVLFLLGLSTAWPSSWLFR